MYDTKQIKMLSITGFGFMNIFANLCIYVYMNFYTTKINDLCAVQSEVDYSDAQRVEL